MLNHLHSYAIDTYGTPCAQPEQQASEQSWALHQTGASDATVPIASEVAVLKFGSSVLSHERELPRVVQEIYRRVQQQQRVVVVVSALGKTTEQLLQRAYSVSEKPSPSAVAALLRTGEATTMALLSLALGDAGIPHSLLDSLQIGLVTEGPHLDSSPQSLDVDALQTALAQAPVAVLPGFVGHNAKGEATLLGRGGSDLTALYVASHLGADCILYKDVDGIYESDPATSAKLPRRYEKLSWADAIALGAVVVQHKAIEFAQRSDQRFSVTQVGAVHGTLVGTDKSEWSEGRVSCSPLRVALLGLGTVGRGVYQHLCAQPKHYEVVGIAVRCPERHIQTGIPASLLSADPWEVIERPCELVVECIGGCEDTADLLEHALRRQRDVVTANKDVIAHHGDRLRNIARVKGTRLRYSASVGGVAPVIETVSRLAAKQPVLRIEGVVNGTTNFVLGRLAEGLSFQDAIKEAQKLGFAEADPTADVEGYDAAHKLAILAFHGLGLSLSPQAISCEGISNLSEQDIANALLRGGVIRLVATCEWKDGEVSATVAPRYLSGEHPLAQVHGEENAVHITTEDGAVHLVAGKGAGRCPTATAVFGDVQAIRTSRALGVFAL